jgi:hypothetical protein
MTFFVFTGNQITTVLVNWRNWKYLYTPKLFHAVLLLMFYVTCVASLILKVNTLRKTSPNSKLVYRDEYKFNKQTLLEGQK